MKIGLIGAGHIGSNLARLAIKNGDDVIISNSRIPKHWQIWWPNWDRMLKLRGLRVPRQRVTWLS
nr:NAD(P)-binding domain-containing protein [Lentilactobacillus kisonensis]